MRMSRLGIFTVCGFMMIAAGCTTYYRVTDTLTGKDYYTTKVEDVGKEGTVKIKDDKSGSTVRIKASEVKEISKDEYKTAIGKQ
ncbi:MAG: hypothetical protein P0119_08510 [Nitrospira sp.]|nr:hypothetical protein [Nitrospira sp.]